MAKHWTTSFALLAICFLPMTSCNRQPEARSGLITELGEHVILPEKRGVEIYEQDGGINYRLTFPDGSVGGGDSPPIEEGSAWFVFVETPDRVWVYDGKDKLRLFRTTGVTHDLFLVHRSDKEWEQAPKEVRIRISPATEHSVSQ